VNKKSQIINGADQGGKRADSRRHPSSIASLLQAEAKPEDGFCEWRDAGSITPSNITKREGFRFRSPPKKARGLQSWTLNPGALDARRSAFTVMTMMTMMMTADPLRARKNKKWIFYSLVPQLFAKSTRFLWEVSGKRLMQNLFPPPPVIPPLQRVAGLWAF
jgi:hypothetical protein